MHFISYKLIVFFFATFNVVMTDVFHGISQWITYDDTFGPIYHIFCGLSFPCTVCTYWWTFSGKTIAGNGSLIEAEASRFSIQQKTNISINNKYFYGDSLLIRNALKTDLGVYECINIKGYRKYRVRIDVAESYYFPSHTYPVCHVSPSTTLLEQSNITFMCTPGESNPPVNLT